MSEDEVRAEFEAWLNSQGLESKWQPERNAYEHFVAHFAYRAWVDSRAALVVVLPEPMEDNPTRWASALTLNAAAPPSKPQA